MSSTDAERALDLLRRRASWLIDCDPDLAPLVAAAGRIVRMHAGQWVQAQGDEETGLAFVVEGAVHLYAKAYGDRVVLLSHAEAGSTVGQSARFGGRPRMVSTVCAIDSTLLILSDAALGRVAVENPAIWEAVASLAYAQLQLALNANVELLALPQRQRLAARLVALSGPGQHLREATLHIGQQSLAELVGMTRPTVNRLLLEFERAGLLRLGYGKLYVVDRPGLRRIADEPGRSSRRAPE